MAKLHTNIVITDELRPCVVKIEAGETRGLFHCWEHISEIIEPSPLKGGHSGGVVSATVGLVELDDGSINKFYPTAIRFVDNKVLQHFRENPISED